MTRQKQDWIAHVVQEHEQRLVMYVWRILGRLDLAQEVVQEAFLKLWKADQEKVELHAKAWLFRVCRNHAIDLIRKHKKLSENEVDEERLISEDPKDHSIEKRMIKQEEASHLLNEVRKLSQKHQEVLRLKFEEELSYKEISAITGHSSSYVGVLLHEAIVKLRDRLSDKEFSELGQGA